LHTWVAKRIAREIADCGAVQFLDEAEIDVGADFEDDILTFLERADARTRSAHYTLGSFYRPYVSAELGAAWERRIPIVGLLYGLTAGELQARPGVPILIKRRDLRPLNEIEVTSVNFVAWSTRILKNRVSQADERAERLHLVLPRRR
jgi:hypothetical protein